MRSPKLLIYCGHVRGELSHTCLAKLVQCAGGSQLLRFQEEAKWANIIRMFDPMLSTFSIGHAYAGFNRYAGTGEQLSRLK